MSISWVRQSLDLLDQGVCVLVTLRQHKGSSPRESGARMIVSEGEVRGSIGGGNLEYQAIATAREMLSGLEREAGSPRLEPYGLGPALNQCCGGSVELLFELITPPAPEWLCKLSVAAERGDPAVLVTATEGESARHFVALPVGRESELPDELRTVVREILDDGISGAIQVIAAAGSDWWLERISESKKPLWLFGAGHVGKAVVKALADLPFEVRWLDGRGDEFPQNIPQNVTTEHRESLHDEVARADVGTTFVVMTHSHELDEDICHAVLKRGGFAYLGMIGSTSKRRRFVHRLSKRGIDEASLERLICPIGLPNIAGKEPATIALSLAAQLMSEPENR